MSNSMLSKTIKIAASITGKRYCSYHRGEADATDGAIVERNKTRKWICNRCLSNIAKRNAEILARADRT